MAGENQTHQNQRGSTGVGLSSVPGEEEKGQAPHFYLCFSKTNETFNEKQGVSSHGQETFPQLRPQAEDLDGIGSTGEEYRRSLRSVTC